MMVLPVRVFTKLWSVSLEFEDFRDFALGGAGCFGELTSALLMKNVSKDFTGNDITKNTWL